MSEPEFEELKKIQNAITDYLLISTFKEFNKEYLIR